MPANDSDPAFAGGVVGVDGEVAAVADMLDTLAAADVGVTVAGLEGLLVRLRRAVEVRRRLASVRPETLRAALLLRRARIVEQR